LCRRRVEEEEPATATTATQTETGEDGAESYEMVELREHEEIVTTLYLHPIPALTTSTADEPLPESSSSTAADPVVVPIQSSTSHVLVTSQQQELKRLTREEITERLHSRGTGTKNTLPGCVVTALMLTAALMLDSTKQRTVTKQTWLSVHWQ